VAREPWRLPVRRTHARADAGRPPRQAADIDGDGDLDIVACALLAGGSDVDESMLPVLVWLQQTTPSTFVRHTIELGAPRHATLDLGDVDGDGDVDIVVGNSSIDKPSPAWVDVWINDGRRAGVTERAPRGDRAATLVR
jgi:hypothetical protein